MKFALPLWKRTAVLNDPWSHSGSPIPPGDVPDNAHVELSLVPVEKGGSVCLVWEARVNCGGGFLAHSIVDDTRLRGEKLGLEVVVAKRRQPESQMLLVMGQMDVGELVFPLLWIPSLRLSTLPSPFCSVICRDLTALGSSSSSSECLWSKGPSPTSSTLSSTAFFLH